MLNKRYARQVLGRQRLPLIVRVGSWLPKGDPAVVLVAYDDSREVANPPGAQGEDLLEALQLDLTRLTWSGTSLPRTKLSAEDIYQMRVWTRQVCMDALSQVSDAAQLTSHILRWMSGR